MLRRLLTLGLFTGMLACEATAAPEHLAPSAGTSATASSQVAPPATAALTGAPAASARAASESGAASGAPTAQSTAASVDRPGGPAIAAITSAAAADLAKDPPHPAVDKGAGLRGPVDTALDGEWITRMATSEIAEVKANKGGGSVSLKVTFADGKKAAVKLAQTGHPTDPRSEIAGYHLDRLVGFGRTAAVVGRRFLLADLRAALVASGTDKAFFDRFEKLTVSPDGHIDAALVAWHTAALTEEEPAPSWSSALDTSEAAAEGALPRLAEWSDLVVFDFLADNPDRYSGGNVLRLGKGGPLVFLDQGAAFGKNRSRDHLTTKDRLDKVCRFQPDTLAALRRIAKDGGLAAALKKSVARDPLAPILDDVQLAAVDARWKDLEAHTGACKKRLGAASTLSSPR